MNDSLSSTPSQPHKRRVRYSGKYPRKFSEKYKEHAPEQYQETVAKVIASGKTPAGTHVPIMVSEILEVLALKPGHHVLDCTLGYGGHAQALLTHILPGGEWIGLDVDPLEQPKTVTRLRALGFSEEVFKVRRCNFAGVLKIKNELCPQGFDAILADLGVSSMQIDNPERGFSVKQGGPLDMRMNPAKGVSASEWLLKVKSEDLEVYLKENSDEPQAHTIASKIAGKKIETTRELAEIIRAIFPNRDREEIDLTIRRVFQAIRIEVNEEWNALETLLRHLPQALASEGIVAIMTFHSGEDRRVKKAFQAGLREGIYQSISEEVIRAGFEERRLNPRSIPAKLRWAKKR